MIFFNYIFYFIHSKNKIYTIAIIKNLIEIYGYNL